MIKLRDLYSIKKTKESDTINDFLDRSIINKYLADHDPAEIESLLRSKDSLSPTMRNFIADVLTGKVKRKKPSTLSRDFEIYCRIKDLRDEYNLTSSTSNPCAASIAAEEFGLEDEAIIKAYQRVDKEIKDDADD